MASKPVIIMHVIMLLLLVSSITTTNSEPAKEKEEICLGQGFDSVDLRCDTCTILGQALGDGVRKDCENCCSSPASYAEIAINRQEAVLFPGLVEFFRDRMKKLESRVRLVHPSSMMPSGKATLILKNENDDIVSQVQVQNWKAESLEEFLRASLPPMP